MHDDFASFDLRSDFHVRQSDIHLDEKYVCMRFSYQIFQPQTKYYSIECTCRSLICFDDLHWIIVPVVVRNITTYKVG